MTRHDSGKVPPPHSSRPVGDFQWDVFVHQRAHHGRHDKLVCHRPPARLRVKQVVGPEIQSLQRVSLPPQAQFFGERHGVRRHRPFPRFGFDIEQVQKLQSPDREVVVIAAFQQIGIGNRIRDVFGDVNHRVRHEKRFGRLPSFADEKCQGLVYLDVWTTVTS